MTGTVAVAGALAAGLLTTMMAPAFAGDQDAVAQAAAAPSYVEQVLAKNGDAAIDPVLGANYRIPALADLGNGVVLASYDGRPFGGDSPEPNSIIQRRSTDNGRTWGTPTYVARGQMPATGVARYGFSDPSYIVDEITGDVFNFFVYSKDVSFQGSGFGSDDADRNITSSAVAVSKDKGLTWSMDPAHMPVLPPVDYAGGSAFAGHAGPLITDVVKPAGITVGAQNNVGGVAGVFAASGAGIQLKYGAHKGRLIQQFTGKVKQADGSTPYQAYSVYSDDHGKTWQRGAFVGTGMDENKTVELSNGDVMMNSRASSGGNGGRKVAISQDGGRSYGPVTIDTSLVDPVNNASIVRMFPNAAQGSDEAKMLLFSNANSSSGRSNGTIRYSCDDGGTWSSGKQFKAGTMSYSTVAPLSDGNFGVFYEGDSNTMTFGKFNAEWLDIQCGVSMTAKAVTGGNGATVQAEMTLVNDGKNTIAGAAGSFTARPGWTFGSTALPEVKPGATATVSVPVTIPDYLKAGPASITATIKYGQSSLSAVVPVTVTGGATSNVVGVDIVGSRTDKSRDLATSPYAVGEQLPYQFVVTSMSNVQAAVVPLTGNFLPFLPPAGSNCRFGALAVGAGYTCGTPKHTVTADELANGFFVPLTTWEVTGASAATKNYTITGEEVDLLVRNPSLEVGVSAGAMADVDKSGTDSAGDVLSHTLTATNNGNVPLTGITGVPTAQRASLDLAVGASVTGVFSYTLSAQDIAKGSVPAQPITVSANNGLKVASADVATSVRALAVAPKPEVTTTAKPTVPATDASPAGGALASTGFNALAIGIGGGLLLVLGAVVVFRTARYQP